MARHDHYVADAGCLKRADDPRDERVVCVETQKPFGLPAHARGQPGRKHDGGNDFGHRSQVTGRKSRVMVLRHRSRSTDVQPMTCADDV